MVPECPPRFPKLHNISWIMGCGRTGSTWLLELLSSFPKIITWNEPYFGTFVSHLWTTPKDVNRVESFFYSQFEQTWTNGLSNLLQEMSRVRFSSAEADDRLVIKEVNAPQIAPYISQVAPGSKYILLVRDPYDVLDSYLDMQRPGAWNEEFSKGLRGTNVVRQTCYHIQQLLDTAVGGFDCHPPTDRMRISYEELHEHTQETLMTVCNFLGLSISEPILKSAIQKNLFIHHPVNGPGQFRRLGFVGSWRVSDHFNDTVLNDAAEVLGDLRRRLGYG